VSPAPTARAAPVDPTASTVHEDDTPPSTSTTIDHPDDLPSTTTTSTGEPPVEPTTTTVTVPPPSGHQALDEWGQARGLTVEQRRAVGVAVESACGSLAAGNPLGQVQAHAVIVLAPVIGELARVAVEVGLGLVCPQYL
jgi:hypothetical protein